MGEHQQQPQLLQGEGPAPQAKTGPRRGVLVTGTGFRSAERPQLLAQCASLGVSYSGDLTCGLTTHLVCKELLGAVNTAKFCKAMEWGVQVVSHQWLIDSVAANRLLPCADYKTDARYGAPSHHHPHHHAKENHHHAASTDGSHCHQHDGTAANNKPCTTANRDQDAAAQPPAAAAAATCTAAPLGWAAAQVAAARRPLCSASPLHAPGQQAAGARGTAACEPPGSFSFQQPRALQQQPQQPQQHWWEQQQQQQQWQGPGQAEPSGPVSSLGNWIGGAMRPPPLQHEPGTPTLCAKAHPSPRNVHHRLPLPQHGQQQQQQEQLQQGQQQGGQCMAGVSGNVLPGCECTWADDDIIPGTQAEYDEAGTPISLVTYLRRAEASAAAAAGARAQLPDGAQPVRSSPPGEGQSCRQLGPGAAQGPDCGQGQAEEDVQMMSPEPPETRSRLSTGARSTSTCGSTGGRGTSGVCGGVEPEAPPQAEDAGGGSPRAASPLPPFAHGCAGQGGGGAGGGQDADAQGEAMVVSPAQQTSSRAHKGELGQPLAWGDDTASCADQAPCAGPAPCASKHWDGGIMGARLTFSDDTAGGGARPDQAAAPSCPPSCAEEHAAGHTQAAAGTAALCGSQAGSQAAGSGSTGATVYPPSASHVTLRRPRAAAAADTHRMDLGGMGGVSLAATASLGAAAHEAGPAAAATPATLDLAAAAASPQGPHAPTTGANAAVQEGAGGAAAAAAAQQPAHQHSHPPVLGTTAQAMLQPMMMQPTPSSDPTWAAALRRGHAGATGGPGAHSEPAPGAGAWGPMEAEEGEVQGSTLGGGERCAGGGAAGGGDAGGGEGSTGALSSVGVAALHAGSGGHCSSSTASCLPSTHLVARAGVDIGEHGGHGARPAAPHRSHAMLPPPQRGAPAPAPAHQQPPQHQQPAVPGGAAGPAAVAPAAAQAPLAPRGAWVEPAQELRAVLQEAVAMAAQAQAPQRALEGLQVLKVLARAPRGTTFKARHGVSSSKALQFAEQVELLVQGAPLVVTCKDRVKNTVFPLVAPSSGGPNGGPGAGGGQGACVAEPVTVYQMADGEWWMEYYRLWTALEAGAAAAGAGRALALPEGCMPAHELLRDTQHAHCRLADVVGRVNVSRSKRPMPGWQRQQRTPAPELHARLRGLALLQVQQRFSFDSRPEAMAVVAPDGGPAAAAAVADA